MAKVRSKYENKLTGKVNEEQVYRDYKKHHSTSLIVGVLVIVCGYIFFFTTPLVFHKPAEVYNTPYNEPQSLSGTSTVSIDDWIYSKNQNLMEIRLNIQNSEFNRNNFKYSSYCNFDLESSGVKKLKVKEQINDINNIIVWIYNVPKDFNSCVLGIFNDSGNSLNLYINKNTVHTSNGIKKLSLYEYRIDNYNNIIKSYNKDIEKNKKDIIKYNKIINEINKKIKTIRSREMYQSKSEVENSENQILSYENDIKNRTDDISTAKSNISSDNEKIKEYKSVIDKIKKHIKEGSTQNSNSASTETTTAPTTAVVNNNTD